MIDAIAIDGPAAAGKTAIGMAVAKALGYRFLDTGAMYRAVAWAALNRSVDVHDERALAKLMEGIRLDIRTAEGHFPEATAVFVDGEDVTPHLRDAEVEEAVSLVSRVPKVRQALVKIQRDVASGGGIVMAGRDIGSVVIPEARVKVYLDASPEVRAERRHQQYGGFDDASRDALADELRRRDSIDSSRETSPLTAAPGAVIINTDDLGLEEVVRRVVTLARRA